MRSDQCDGMFGFAVRGPRFEGRVLLYCQLETFFLVGGCCARIFSYICCGDLMGLDVEG